MVSVNTDTREGEDMDKYYLRVEAVNFTYFIYDTDKIQPMRGGSYLLLESVASLAGQEINGVKLKKIMTGASIGLFSFELAKAEPDGKAEKIAAEVRKILSDNTKCHATFVVNALKESENGFEHDNETITAMNRWQQFQQPTLVLPEKEADDKCFYDGVRPGSAGAETPDGVKPVSNSVLFRMKEGKDLRPNIYKRILKDKSFKEDFTSDLEKLSKDEVKTNLNGKMAFIYVDGNKFTKIRADKCKSEQTLTDFSECVEKHRKNFLCELIQKAKDESDFKNSGDIRLETLLWGGDDLEIVVPAWKGLEVLRLFYKCMSIAEFDGVQLTHAGGIIFSNHKAPIRQIRDMARKLADMAKEKLSGDFSSFQHNTHDIAHYLIMESFDIVGSDVKDFVKRYYGEGCYNDFILTAGRMNDITDAITIMKANGFPHNKIFEIISIIKGYPSTETKKRIELVFDKALSDVKDRDKVCAAIEKVIEQNGHRWLLLADLWDYAGREHA